MVTVHAAEHWNDSQLDVLEGDMVGVAAAGVWIDGSMPPCDAVGFERWHLAPFRFRRRCRHANWFCLIAQVGKDGMPHPVGVSGQFSADRSGRAFLYANDLWSRYGNNQGASEVILERTSA
jgi:hypothetical protein